MIIDEARVPLGRVGIASKGSPKGLFIYLYPEDFEDAWSLVLEGRARLFNLEGYGFSPYNLISGTERVNALLEAWGIKWLYGEAEIEVERRIFNDRSSIRQAD